MKWRWLALLFALGLALAAYGCLGLGDMGTRRLVPAAACNAECVLCHKDFKTEELAARHADAGIGCIGCHGTSAAHVHDDLNLTPPDVLYGRTEVMPFCTKCHLTHGASLARDAFFRTWQGKRRPNGRLILENAICTDCHGTHVVLPPDKKAELQTGQ